MGLFMGKKIPWKILKENKLGTRPAWDEGFMADAIRASSRSSCWKVHSGSVIVYDKRIIGTGYNGAPAEVPSCIDLNGCYKEIQTGKKYEETMNIGICQGVHSEMNAIFNLSKEIPLKSATLYTTIFPCNGCAKNMQAKRIFNKIIFRRAYDEKELKGALRIFQEADIEVCKLELSPERYLDIIFNHRNAKFDAWTSEEKERASKGLELMLKGI